MADVAKQYTSAFADYPGNIDLNNRQVYNIPGGGIKTEESIGVAFDPGDQYSIHIPTVVNGKPVSVDEAKQHFMNTGEHLGVAYRRPGESIEDFYKRDEQQSNALHERQDRYYNKKEGSTMGNSILDISKHKEGLAAAKINEFNNQQLGYGLSRKEVADIFGVPVGEVDSLLKQQDEAYDLQGAYSPTGSGPAVNSDQLLQSIAAKKQAYMNDAITANRNYNQSKSVVKPTAPSADDVAFYGQDGVNVMKGYDEGLAEYIKAQNAVKAYEQNIDPTVAAKWMENFNYLNNQK